MNAGKDRAHRLPGPVNAQGARNNEPTLSGVGQHVAHAKPETYRGRVADVLLPADDRAASGAVEGAPAEARGASGAVVAVGAPADGRDASGTGATGTRFSAASKMGSPRCQAWLLSVQDRERGVPWSACAARTVRDGARASAALASVSSVPSVSVVRATSHPVSTR